VQTSCGYGVPLFTDLPEEGTNGAKLRLQDRKTLGHWASQQVEKGVLDQYRAKNNARSLDGLGGMKVARRHRGEILLLGDVEIWFKRVLQQWDAMLLGAFLAIIAFVFLPSVRHRYAIQL